MGQRLADRVVASPERRGEVMLHRLSGATEFACRRCGARQSSRWGAVLADD
ncbi:hypothetical protein BJ982_005498 [Sphaerisporangium siamense]|uniref:Uncharacterized protein n=1 Tax=Sphaerisporangium siamense TaxID=795645 RepID=A0A7W7DCC8_9ACTN|nr:hypothetical protein [Sphaerisporangium siamense]